MEQKSLTSKQLEYLAKAARGLTYEKIAKECFVTKKTVSTSMEFARKRLGTKNTLQCLAVAISREELGIDHEGYTFVPGKIE